jgi:hypothetical protein
MSDTKKTAKKKVAAKADDGMITLRTLATELKITPRAARIKLRAAELKRDGLWAWKDGSAELTKIRKLLSE